MPNDKSYKEFLAEVKKVKGPRVSKFSKTLDSREAFFFYRRTRPKTADFVIKEKVFTTIINDMNLLIADKLLATGSVTLPEGLGKISIIKMKTDSWLNEAGELQTNRAVDMASTLKLWYEDPAAKEAKTLVRFDNPYKFKILYCKSKAKFKNSIYFNLRFNRELKIRLKNLITNTDYDAYEKSPMDKY